MRQSDIKVELIISDDMPQRIAEAAVAVLEGMRGQC